MQVNYKTITTLEFDIFTGGYKQVEKQVEDTQTAFADNSFAELLAGSGFGDDASPVKTSNEDFFALSESQESLGGGDFGGFGAGLSGGLNGEFGGVVGSNSDFVGANVDLSGEFGAVSAGLSNSNDDFNATNLNAISGSNAGGKGFENDLMTSIYELRFRTSQGITLQNDDSQNAISQGSQADLQSVNLQNSQGVQGSQISQNAQNSLIKDLLNSI